MELENDPELHKLLSEWKAPAAPESLESRVLRNHRPWWQVLVHGYIRVPVPLACCLLIAMIVGAWRIATLSVNVCSASSAAQQFEPPARPVATCAADSSC